ncbi:MAG: hypothetical protein V8Q30_13095 [Acutalibacteraceae bacterium]
MVPRIWLWVLPWQQLLGYPATYLITQEIARTVGKTEEEVDAITARI